MKTLRDIHSNELATDELSYRPALNELLNNAAGFFNKPVQFITEAKKTKAGKPDYTLSRMGEAIGYLEAEAFGVDLDHLVGQAKEQNERYRKYLDNFILTNYLEFRLYIGGQEIKNIRLPYPGKTVKVTEVEASQLSDLLEHFLEGHLPCLNTSEDLAIHLARRTRQMYNEILNVVKDKDSGKNGINEAYEAFKQILLSDLTEEEFADMYTQMIAYGLFAARCALPSNQVFNRLTAANFIPTTNPFLRKLFQHLAAFDLDQRVAWIADDTALLLARADMEAILSDFGKRTGKEDPVVHFYETFLAAYNPELRELRGVYYTPEPVVDYIVRSIDYLLKVKFEKPLGLADEKTLILDPATGTGSFLFAVIKSIRETLRQKIGTGAVAGASWNSYVREKLLPRIFGFELLIAPYAVAHLKLGLLLQETGYNFEGNQRIGIYLANALDEAVKKSEILFGKYISDEANKAVVIKKEKPILVVLGNPPYSGHSANRSWVIVKGKKKPTFIGKLIENYKYVDSKRLEEKNPKWLHDDYVKFIRFAQWRIDRTGEGIIGYITNHGYLDNPTFRGMRQSLMLSFNEIYILNLHGNIRKGEKSPYGDKDENVFDIQQGTAILLCVKQKNNNQPARIYYADLWGSRELKRHYLTEKDISTTKWIELKPASPFYFFVQQDTDLKTEYEQGWKLNEVFSKTLLGPNSHRDHFAIAFTYNEALTRLRDFADLSLPDNVIRERYNLKDNRDWSLFKARRKYDLKNVTPVKCLYRPFDFRFMLYGRFAFDYPRTELNDQLLKENIALIFSRQTKDNFSVLVSKVPVGQHKLVTRYDGSYLSPLYLYSSEPTISAIENYKINFTSSFLEFLSNKLGLKQIEPFDLPKGITPEDILGYIYAVLNSKTYCMRYINFLKIDFPRVILTSDLDLFRKLSSLGIKLINLHLLDDQKAPQLNKIFSPFSVPGNNLVENVVYDKEKERVYINKEQYFSNVPEEIWEFNIGGHKICEKWLDDRKKRTLTIDDIQYYQRIVVVISETIKIMDEIDDIIKLPLT